MIFGRIVASISAFFFAIASTPDARATYRVSIAFGSHASGIDHVAHRRFNAILKEFDSKYRVRIEYWGIAWGKEGEVSYCFELTELTPSAQAEFVSGLRDLTRNQVNGWTRVEENGGCLSSGPMKWFRRSD